MKRQYNFDGIVGVPRGDCLRALVNQYVFNQPSSTEQAARTKKVYQVEPIENRIVDLERTAAVHHHKLEKRRVWMEGVQADIVASGSDRFTMSDYLKFMEQVKKLNPEVIIPNLQPDLDDKTLPLLPRDQD